jgi:hypothetical protein
LSRTYLKIVDSMKTDTYMDIYGAPERRTLDTDPGTLSQKSTSRRARRKPVPARSVLEVTSITSTQVTFRVFDAAGAPMASTAVDMYADASM